MPEIEIFAPNGVLAGETERVPLTNAGRDLTAPLAVEDARWYPLDGSSPSRGGDTSIPPDDILIIVTAEHELKVNMAWHAVTLEVGPYRVSGQLATHPGFDPERAIGRPSSTSVALSEATVELLGHALAPPRAVSPPTCAECLLPDHRRAKVSRVPAIPDVVRRRGLSVTRGRLLIDRAAQAAR